MEAELRQVLGHVKASTFDKYYLAKSPFADSQSVILGQQQRKDLTSQFHRAGNYRDERAPQELPPEEMAKIEENPELKESIMAKEDKKQQLQTDYGSIKNSPGDFKRSILDSGSVRQTSTASYKKRLWKSIGNPGVVR